MSVCSGEPDTGFGPAGGSLPLISRGSWAETARVAVADGLRAVFFFVAGLELKRQLVAGDLRDPRRAAIPIVAAVGGVVLPALLYLLVNRGPGGDPSGWAIPTATDIAFALTGSVLAAVVAGVFLSLRSRRRRPRADGQRRRRCPRRRPALTITRCARGCPATRPLTAAAPGDRPEPGSVGA